MEICPNPILLSSDIAARTKNIRIGQAASIITFWNPIRAAEDIALLDQLSMEEFKQELEEVFMEEKLST